MRATEAQHLLTQAVHLMEQNKTLFRAVMDGEAAALRQRVIAGKGQQQAFTEEHVCLHPVVVNGQGNQGQVEIAGHDGGEQPLRHVFVDG